ncbi:MAG: AAA family ATPase [Methylococcales bacterium]|nr:AAA family ATPase [Methylococcales bacterium]
MKIEALRVKNFKTFKDIKLSNLPAISVFIGANGTGKTTLFDVFGFLRDSLQDNVKVALQKRGGFKEVVTRGETGPIEIEIKFREHDEGTHSPLVTYSLTISLENHQPVVEREILKYRRGQKGKPWHFLDFSKGKGDAITNEENYSDKESKEEKVQQQVDSPDILALKGLGQFQRFKAANSFRRLIESWHVSDFHIGDARPSQEAGYAEHLSTRGENMPLVAQYLYENHPDIFQHILKIMAERVPGVSKVEATNTDDGRILLKFQDGSFKDPFIARYVSDGTIKMFAYLLLLHDPKPHPLLCVEEPENQLYPSLFCGLVEEFRNYADKGGQVMISTHSPDVLNYIELNEIFCLSKKQGITIINRASENELLVNLSKEGDLPGALWKQGLFSEVNPA